MKKIICAFLAIIMTLSASSLLFSCSGSGDEKKDGSYEGKVYEEDSIFYERSLISDDLPDVDYGGRPLFEPLALQALPRLSFIRPSTPSSKNTRSHLCTCF